jgi:hypothetical protein
MDTIVLGNLSRINSCSVLKLWSISLYLKQRHALPNAHARPRALFLKCALPSRHFCMVESGAHEDKAGVRYIFDC